MRGRRFSAMCTTALEQDRDALAREPLTQFVDGSAAMACQAFDYEGDVWITNGHFMMIAGPIDAFPDEGKIKCPAVVPEILAAAPSTRYAPRIEDAEGGLRFAEAHALGVATAASKRAVHMAGKIAEDGGVSARCFARPRKIDMSRETWTTDPAAVTCPGCKAKIGCAS